MDEENLSTYETGSLEKLPVEDSEGEVVQKVEPVVVPAEDRKLTEEQGKEILSFISISANRHNGYKNLLARKYGVLLGEIDRVLRGYELSEDDKKCACGNPIIGRSRTGCSVECVFKSFYTVDPNTGCWVWHGHVSHLYGKPFFVCTPFEKGGKVIHMSAARYAHNTFRTPTNDSLVSTCGNPRCVNPDHVRVVVREGSTGKPPQSGLLGELEILAIREAIVSNYDLSQKYGVSESCIRKIRTGQVRLDVGGRIVDPKDIPRKSRKMDPEKVAALLQKLREGASYKSVAEEYGVHESLVSRIANGKYHYSDYLERKCEVCGTKIQSGKFCSLDCLIKGKVVKDEVTGCWNIPGGVTLPYRRKTINIRTYLAGTEGGLPNGTTCGNKLCVNPDHVRRISDKEEKKAVKRVRKPKKETSLIGTTNPVIGAPMVSEEPKVLPVAEEGKKVITPSYNNLV